MDCPSDLLGPPGLDDQLDSLVGLLQYQEVPQGLDDLLPTMNSDNLPDLEVLLKTELSSDNTAASRLGSVPFSVFQHQHQTSDLMDVANNTDAQEEEDGGNDGKRRRRIRNAKQQELNRLAQQRYRQRKKQKYTDLQVTVDELSEKMATIARLEDEAGELKGREAAAQNLVASKEAALAEAQAAVRQQALMLEQQRQKLGEQQQQLEALKQQKQPSSPLRPPSPRSSSPAPSLQQGPSQPQQAALCDRLLEALRAALTDVCEEQGLHASSSAQEQVLLRFRRSLNSCCKEVLAAAAATAPADGPGAGVAPLLSSAAGSQMVVAGAAAAALVGVPAAGQKVQEAAHRLSVTCY